jgi:hypothetical protein
VNHEDIKIPYDMKCANCQHTASDHWWSYGGQLQNGECHACIGKDIHSPMFMCYEFKWDNLNYVEVMASRREQEKNLI